MVWIGWCFFLCRCSFFAPVRPEPGMAKGGSLRCCKFYFNELSKTDFNLPATYLWIVSEINVWQVIPSSSAFLPFLGYLERTHLYLFKNLFYLLKSKYFGFYFIKKIPIKNDMMQNNNKGITKSLLAIILYFSNIM